MNIKDIISNIDLCNGQLDIAGNQIAYPARAALINSAKALVKARGDSVESIDSVVNTDEHSDKAHASYEQHARFASLCAINLALGVMFDLRNIRDTVVFVLRAEAPSEPVDYKALVERDHLNGRIFVRDHAHLDEMIALRREQDIAKRAEAQGEVADVIDMIDNGMALVQAGEYFVMHEGEKIALGFDADLIEGETDAISDKVARSCIDAKERMQRDLDRCFVPERYQRLTAALAGINQLLEHLGVSEGSLKVMREKRREHLNAILATPAQPKKMKVVKAAA